MYKMNKAEKLTFVLMAAFMGLMVVFNLAAFAVPANASYPIYAWLSGIGFVVSLVGHVIIVIKTWIRGY